MHPFRDGQTFAGDIALAVSRSVDLAKLRATVLEGVARAVSDRRISQAHRIHLGGSGDSLFAALGAVHALRRWTGMAVEARPALDLSRYSAPLFDGRDLVVAISNSGNSSRARETVRLAKDRHAPTIGVTGSLSGAVSREADYVIHRPVEEQIGLAPHYEGCLVNLSEYLALLYALYSLGLALGVERGRITEALRRAQLESVERAIEAQGAIAARIESAAAALAEALGDIDTIWAIGSGPSQGTARYSAAKFHEQMPINGIGQDLEEWAHLEYFLTLEWGPRSVVLVVAPQGNCRDRAWEIVQGIEAAGGRAVVVHNGSQGASPPAFSRFDLEFEIEEWLSPLIYHLPAQLLVLHMAARAGIRHIPLRRRDGGWLIAQGIVRDRAAGLG